MLAVLVSGCVSCLSSSFNSPLPSLSHLSDSSVEYILLWLCGFQSGYYSYIIWQLSAHPELTHCHQVHHMPWLPVLTRRVLYGGSDWLTSLFQFALPPCHTVFRSYCHPVTLSHCHLVTLPPCYTVTLSHCLPVTLSPCYTVTLSHCLPVILSPCHTVSLSHCHPITLSPYHTVSLSHCLPVPLSPCSTVTRSHCLPVTLSPCHTVSRSYCHTVTLYTVTLSPSHTVSRSYCHTVILSHCHTVTLFPSHTVSRSYCHLVILSPCLPVILFHCDTTSTLGIMVSPAETRPCFNQECVLYFPLTNLEVLLLSNIGHGHKFCTELPCKRFPLPTVTINLWMTHQSTTILPTPEWNYTSALWEWLTQSENSHHAVAVLSDISEKLEFIIAFLLWLLDHYNSTEINTCVEVGTDN